MGFFYSFSREARKTFLSTFYVFFGAKRRKFLSTFLSTFARSAKRPFLSTFFKAFRAKREKKFKHFFGLIKPRRQTLKKTLLQLNAKVGAVGGFVHYIMIKIRL